MDYILETAMEFFKGVIRPIKQLRDEMPWGMPLTFIVQNNTHIDSANEWRNINNW